MIGKRISNFLITQELGTGGMGTVYKAKDTNLNRNVALKMLHNHITSSSNSYRRFKNEAQISAQITHPNVATLYDFIDVNGTSYIIMEYVDGKTLESILDNNTLSEKDCINYTIQILKGLSEAHNLEILHRDLKPANIMVKKNGYVKLMDFGIAKMENATRLTAHNKVVGTIEYMAPEILKGQDPNRTSDLYAVGVMLYEMLTGETLYKGQSEASLMYQIVNEKPTMNTKGINPSLVKIIKKLTIKNPLLRYRNTSEVIKALENIKDTNPALSPITKLDFKSFFNKKVNLDFSSVFNFSNFTSFTGDNKAIKFVLFSLLISLSIVILSSLFSGLSSKEIKTEVPTAIEIKDNILAEPQEITNSQPKKNTHSIVTTPPKSIEVDRKKETPKAIEKEAEPQIQKRSQTQSKSKPKSIEVKKSTATKSNLETGEAQPKSTPEQETPEPVKNIEIKKDNIEESDSKSEPVKIENETVSKKEKLALEVQEQYLPVVFTNVINSKEYEEGQTVMLQAATDLFVNGLKIVARGAEVKAVVSRKKVKGNGKVIFAIKILNVKSVAGEWLELDYPEYSDIQKHAVIIPAKTRMSKVKIKTQQLTIYK